MRLRPTKQFRLNCQIVGWVIVCEGIAVLIASAVVSEEQIQTWLTVPAELWGKRALVASMGALLLAFGVGIVRIQSWVLYGMPIWMTSVLTGGSAIQAFAVPAEQQVPLVARVFATILILVIFSVTLFGTQILWKPWKRKAFLDSLSPKRRNSYKFIVAPLGVFLSCFGFNLFSAALLLPADQLHTTLVESTEAKRVLSASIAILFLLFGVGLIRMWFVKHNCVDHGRT